MHILQAKSGALKACVCCLDGLFLQNQIHCMNLFAECLICCFIHLVNKHGPLKSTAHFPSFVPSSSCSSLVLSHSIRCPWYVFICGRGFPNVGALTPASKGWPTPKGGMDAAEPCVDSCFGSRSRNRMFLCNVVWKHCLPWLHTEVLAPSGLCQKA